MAIKVSCYAKFKQHFLDDSFSTFEEFHEKFQKFQDDTFSLYRIFDSNKVETENVRRKAKLDLNLKYASVSFCCIHYGQEKGKGNGVHERAKGFPQNCSSLIRLSASARDQQLRIVHANVTHNHELTIELYKSYQKSWIFATDEGAARVITNGEVKNKEVKVNTKRPIKDKKTVTAAKRKKTKKKCNENVEAEVWALEQKKEAKIIVDEGKKQVQVIALATVKMKLLFEQFPDGIFIDATTKPNKHGFFLYQIIVEDEMKRSRTVCYVFTRDKAKDNLVLVLNCFLELVPNAASLVKTIMLGMGFQQLQLVQGILPLTRIFWCQFRVLRLCKKRIDRLQISLVKKRMLFIKLKEAIMADDESGFIAATEGIRSVDSKFFDSFQEEWLPSIEFWATFERRNLPIVANTTNILNQEMLQNVPNASKSIYGLVWALVDANEVLVTNNSGKGSLTPELQHFLKLHGSLESTLMRRNCGKLKSLTIAAEEAEEHVQAVCENGLNFIVKIDGDVTDCNCTFFSRYGLPCRHLIYSCQHQKLNLISLVDGHCVTPVENPATVDIVMVQEVKEEELSGEQRMRMVTDITRRMNQALGHLKIVHFQKWMRVLQEVKHIVETEFEESQNGSDGT